MDLCYIKPEKLIRLKRRKEIEIEFLGANSRKNGFIERHYLVNGSYKMTLAGIDSMTLEQDYYHIRKIYETFGLIKHVRLKSKKSS